MSSSGKVARVSIPESVKKMIQNIHEITGAHEDEIYATLKECSMDPNETAQKLLSQDAFHEVKSKRDKRKENMGNKEPVESKWKPSQERGGRGGRGSYSSRYVSNDKNTPVVKENTSNQASEKSTGLPLSSSPQEAKPNAPVVVTRIAPVTANGPSAIVAKGTKAHISKSGGPTPHENITIVKENLRENSGRRKTHGQLSSSDTSATETLVSSPGAHFSSSDPVLVPSHDSRVPGAAGTIKREVRSQRNPTEQISAFLSEGKPVAATSEVGKKQLETIARPSSAHSGSSVVRPSSNHSSRSQVVGPPKGTAMEWKAKTTSATLAQGSSLAGQSEVSAALEVDIQSRPVTGDLDSKETSTKLEKKLEEKLEDLHISNNQQVVIPNHLHVPGAEKVSFCFGSFDAITVDTSLTNSICDNSPTTPPMEAYQSVEEAVEETSVLENVLATTEEGAHHDHSQTPEDATENLPNGEPEVPSTVAQDYGEPKPESDVAQGSHQFPTLYTSPGYGFGLMPTIMGSHLPPFESSDSQGREIPNVPSLLVQPAFDPVSYYTQIYRPSVEGDGRVSPFHGSVATKYNGGVAVLPPQTSPSAPEGGNTLPMSTSAPNAFAATQPTAGVVPNSIAATQQPVSVFRHPYGFSIPQYPHNFMPYPYISPYIFPHFNPSLGNTVYPQQQPQAGSVYPAPPPGQSPKFFLPQYKPGTSSGNSTSVGVASSYGPYGPSGSTAGNSAPNEDLSQQQFKENNVYIAGQQQQSEGSAVWLTPPGREMPTSFYNIPSQGQVAYPQPHLGGHNGPFTSIYHTPTPTQQLLQQSQTMASNVDVGPPPNVYPQHAQVNWPNNNY